MKSLHTNDGAVIAPAADGGLLDRRLFLKKGLVFGTFALASDHIPADELQRTAAMLTPGAPFSGYGQPSPFEQGLLRNVAANAAVAGNGASMTPLERLAGTLTPSGLHFERHHNGVPKIDPALHRLIIHGKVAKPLSFSLERLKRYPMTSHLCVIECGGNSFSGWHKEAMQGTPGSLHGLVSCSEWTGVPLSLLLHEAEPAADADWIIAEGADAAALNISIPRAKAMDDALLALYQNGEAIRPENGYPMRLVLPGWEGVTQVKWLRRLETSDRPVMSRNETAKYTELQPDGSARQFTFSMGVKSVITAPAGGYRLTEQGYYSLSGLAWSGQGRVASVDVSADGGKTWAEAELCAPVLPKAYTRFRIPWQWQGQPATLQSRATDEHGNMQPTRARLVQERGQAGYFHYNAIISWQVEPDGYIHHIFA
ncbi:sulfite dehydrogenase [Candidatus Methylospira mobilis]|uniref:Sulfite dehydrogenase n=1 Tax=Candidatus Methylospira mobilis TaxID=1808979 RepID=A0A5Q0BJQ6_9GAMM|nr:sulfite dehydrogenase [Candidatus Methylospira mobilis]QFY42397.1 sulfite dehydrogenase [Candidatus Methylospira mobilis]